MEVSPCYSPNTFFAYRIDVIRIVSESIVIASDPLDPGQMEAVTLYPKDRAVSFSARSIFVNGQPDSLYGWGPLAPNRNGDTLELELQSALFVLHLEAVRNGPPYDWGADHGLCFPNKSIQADGPSGHR